MLSSKYFKHYHYTKNPKMFKDLLSVIEANREALLKCGDQKKMIKKRKVNNSLSVGCGRRVEGQKGDYKSQSQS